MILFSIVRVGSGATFVNASVQNAKWNVLNTTPNRYDEDFINVYLVVADPSSTTYSTLGHDCLRLQCKTYGLDYMFSYESEDVSKKIITYLSGNLKMGMFKIDPKEYIDFYSRSQRGVRQYKLNLSHEVKVRLWQILDEEMMKGAYLPYDYLERGCAQSIFRFLIVAIGKENITFGPWDEKFKQTRRELVSSNLTDFPWVDCLFGLAVGTEADKDVPNVEKVVIPADLVGVLQNATFNGENIISDKGQQLTKSFPATPYRGITPIALAIMIVVLELFSICMQEKWSKLIDIILIIALTMMGSFIAYLLVFSHLPNTTWNWLIIPFNPLPAIFWYWRKYWALPYALLTIAWIIGMLVYPHTLVNTAYILLAGAEMIILVKQTVLYNNLSKFKNK